MAKPLICGTFASPVAFNLRSAMYHRSFFLGWISVICATSSAFAQLPIRFENDAAEQSPVVAATSFFPTQEQALEPAFERVPPIDGFRAPESPVSESFSKARLAQLMRPTFGWGAEWQARASEVELVSYDARVQLPTYPIFGPPPPFINGGFSYTNLTAPPSFDLPSDLYDYSLGFSWMRPIDDRWMLRFMFSAALATDGKNTTSDAWQFRGGVFGMYRKSPAWTWIIGAIALGRNDIPAVPAVGAIWQPTPGLRFDLTLPKPKIAFVLTDDGLRQQWAYIGGGLNGGTWAYERASGSHDQLTYADWRVVVGWESTPALEPGMPFARGRKFGVEVGYVFSRDFEFKSDLPTIRLADTWMLRGTASF